MHGTGQSLDQLQHSLGHQQLPGRTSSLKTSSNSSLPIASITVSTTRPSFPMCLYRVFNVFSTTICVKSNLFQVTLFYRLLMLEQIDLRMRQSMHFVFQNRRQLTPIDIQRVCIIFSLCISLKFIEKVQTTYHVAQVKNLLSAKMYSILC